MDIVNEVLRKAAAEAEKFKPITVEKHLEVEFDVGNLLAFDTNEIELQKLRSDCDQYLKDLTRDNTQLLINKVWELPTKRVEEAIVAELPKITHIIPRSQPVPKPKELTKWEKFAKEKGIVKTKKSKLEWDDVLQKWIPRFGYKRAAAEAQKDWVIEVPGNADPMEDQFAKKRKIKQENVAKNELQRMRNIAKAKKVKVPRVGMLPTEKLSTRDLHKAATIAKVSTASGGKFQSNLRKEKAAKDVKHLMPVAPPVKRKKPNPTREEEKKTNIDVVDKILNKRPNIDIEAAVNKHLHIEYSGGDEKGKSPKAKAGRSGKKRSSGSGGSSGRKSKVGGRGRKKGGGGRKRR